MEKRKLKSKEMGDAGLVKGAIAMSDWALQPSPKNNRSDSEGGVSMLCGV